MHVQGTIHAHLADYRIETKATLDHNIHLISVH